MARPRSATATQQTTSQPAQNPHGDHETKFPPFEQSFTAYLSDRETELLDATRQFLYEHECWVAAGDDDRPHPDEEYWDAVDALVESFDVGDIPQSLRDVFQAVESFREQVDAFGQRADVARAMPNKQFWKAREIVEEVYFSTIHAETEPVYPPLEPIKLLIDGDQYGSGKVNWQQVAKMYRWFDRDGNPDVAKVMKEYQDPGSVIGPDWVDPRIAEWRVERLRKKRQSGGSAGIPKSPKAKRGKADDEDSKPCKETPFELWKLPGMPVAQAARMLKKPMEEVQALFDGFQAKKDEEERRRLGIVDSPANVSAANNVNTTPASPPTNNESTTTPTPATTTKTPTPMQPVGRTPQAVPKNLPNSSS